MLIPVIFPETVGGLQETAGLIQISGNKLVIEFSSKDALFGVVKSAPEEHSIAMEDLASHELKMGWFRTRLVLRFRSLALASRFPGHEGPELTLKIKRKDRDAARALVSRLEALQTEHRLSGLEREMKALEEKS